MERVDGLKIMTSNARGWSSKKEELQRHIQNYDINVITEIKCRMYDNIRVTGYRSIVGSRISNIGRGIGGVAILIKNNISMEEISNIVVAKDEMDCVGIRLRNIEECEEVAVVGIYRKPGPTRKKNVEESSKIIKRRKECNSSRRL